jgi:nitrilase
MSTTVAVVAATPVFLDRQATVDKACALVTEAAARGAELVLFAETFVPTYPVWVWDTPAWGDDQFVRRLYDQSVTVPSATTDRLGRTARAAGAYISIGVNELDGGTLYNTQLLFAPDGSLVDRHRKLMPTGGERTVWGYGDGSTLNVVTTPFGVVGGLICWENYMPLARAAMYARGVEIYLAPTYDDGPIWVPTLQHIAKEGRCYVLSVSPVLRGSDVPADLRGDLYGGDDDWLSRGLATVVAPGGDILAGPLAGEEGIVYAEIDRSEVARERQYFDPVGHYSRPDVFSLHVDTRPRPPVTFDAG